MDKDFTLEPDLEWLTENELAVLKESLDKATGLFVPVLRADLRQVIAEIETWRTTYEAFLMAKILEQDPPMGDEPAE